MKTSKKLLSILLSVLMVVLTVSCLAVCFTVSAYDTIEFGNYPQSKVSETTALKNAANNATWKSYNYYLGNGTDFPSYDGNMYQDDFMKYADFFLNGVKYRAVKFTKYRPENTGYTSSSGHSYQDNNGYATNTVYYFKYEPLTWRVLDADTGLVLCDSIIDAQAFQNEVLDNGSKYYVAGTSDYANNYAVSSIRTWLNNKFYNTAFNDTQKAKIKNTTTNNNAYSSDYSLFNSPSTTNKIFLLSYSEAQNSSYNYFSRRAKGTDYAKCQGLWVSNYSSSVGYSVWRLRSPGNASCYSCNVDFGGSIGVNYRVSNTNSGIRPACVLTNLASDISQSDVHTISVSADPSGAGTVSGGGAYGKGETVTLSASPNTGYYFCDWYYITSSNTYQQVSTNATCTVTVGDADRTYYAEFMPYSYDVTPVASPAAGGSVTGGGRFTYNTSATVRASASTGYHFDGWYKNGTKVSGSLNYTFTVTGDVTLVAKFVKTYKVTVNAQTGGGATGGGTFIEGATATVKATPNSGYHFTGWYKGNSKVSGDANYSFTVTENVTLTAKFEPVPTYTVTANAGAGGSATGGGTFNEGATATLIATPDSGYLFLGWYKGDSNVSSNASYSFTVTEDVTLTAKFFSTANLKTIPQSPEGLKNGDYYYDFDAIVPVFVDTGMDEAFAQEYVNMLREGSIVKYDPSTGLIVFANRENPDNEDDWFVIRPGSDDHAAAGAGVKVYQAPGTSDPGTPDNPGGGQQTGGCKWCGKDHNANFFQKIIGWFHGIFAKIFGARY